MGIDLKRGTGDLEAAKERPRRRVGSDLVGDAMVESNCPHRWHGQVHDHRDCARGGDRLRRRPVEERLGRRDEVIARKAQQALAPGARTWTEERVPGAVKALVMSRSHSRWSVLSMQGVRSGSFVAATTIAMVGPAAAWQGTGSAWWAPDARRHGRSGSLPTCAPTQCQRCSTSGPWRYFLEPQSTLTRPQHRTSTLPGSVGEPPRIET
ncbi:MAG: hypothetical protein K0R44_1877 [Thermomicrobiales bacterium]|nr:hypothetical protein [Thermomicrobiales bacterium]